MRRLRCHGNSRIGKQPNTIDLGVIIDSGRERGVRPQSYQFHLVLSLLSDNTIPGGLAGPLRMLRQIIRLKQTVVGQPNLISPLC